jgi:peptidoglycan/xylan/chitin deacetylase (PgdA/CDA1 family)
MAWRPGSRQMAAALRVTGVGGLLRRAGAWRGVVALAYHRIGDGSDSRFDRGLYSATPEDFDAQVRLLKQHCDVIGPDALKDVVRRGRGRYALVTFDDGYRDNYTKAFPVLKSHNVPGVFFVSTGFIDQPRLPWWDEIAWMARSATGGVVEAGGWLDGDVVLNGTDREGAIRTLLRKYKSLPGDRTAPYVEYLADATGVGRYAARGVADTWMTWEMLREMRRGGMHIAGHTVNHPVLARLPREGQRTEISGCAARLAAELGEPMRWFSYPVGGPNAFNQDTRDCLREQGVELAFTYYGTFGRFGAWDDYAVPRVAVERYTSLGDLGAVLALPQVFA